MPVRRRSKVFRSTFGKLPKGAVYYLSATSGPFVKQTGHSTLVANGAPTTSANAAGTTVSDVSVAVQRVGKYFLGQDAI